MSRESATPPGHVPLDGAPAAEGAPERAARWALHFARNYATVGILAVLIVVFWLTTTTFMTVSNIQNVLIVQTITAALAFAAMLPLIVGEFDLSLGYSIGFLVMVGAYLAGKGVSTPVVVLAMLGCGALVGFFNAMLTVYVGISSFIATLGVGIVLQGATQGISNGEVLFENIPKFMQTVGASYAGGLAISVWVTAVIAVILYYVLEQTPFGRYWYAIGGSEQVAFLAGLRTKWLKVAAFVGAGFLVGVGAIFALGQTGSANPGFGPDLLLPAYAAAFLGVTTFRAGYYNIVGTVVAILLVGFGFNGLALLGVPFWAQPVFNGAVLLIAVMVARAEARQVHVGR